MSNIEHLSRNYYYLLFLQNSLHYGYGANLAQTLLQTFILANERGGFEMFYDGRIQLIEMSDAKATFSWVFAHVARTAKEILPVNRPLFMSNLQGYIIDIANNNSFVLAAIAAAKNPRFYLSEKIRMKAEFFGLRVNSDIFGFDRRLSVMAATVRSLFDVNLICNVSNNSVAFLREQVANNLLSRSIAP